MKKNLKAILAVVLSVAIILTIAIVANAAPGASDKVYIQGHDNGLVNWGTDNTFTTGNDTDGNYTNIVFGSDVAQARTISGTAIDATTYARLVLRAKTTNSVKFEFEGNGGTKVPSNQNTVSQIQSTYGLNSMNVFVFDLGPINTAEAGVMSTLNIIKIRSEGTMKVYEMYLTNSSMEEIDPYWASQSDSQSVSPSQDPSDPSEPTSDQEVKFSATADVTEVSPGDKVKITTWIEGGSADHKIDAYGPILLSYNKVNFTPATELVFDEDENREIPEPKSNPVGSIEAAVKSIGGTIAAGDEPEFGLFFPKVGVNPSTGYIASDFAYGKSSAGELDYITSAKESMATIEFTVAANCPTGKYEFKIQNGSVIGLTNDVISMADKTADKPSVTYTSVSIDVTDTKYDVTFNANGGSAVAKQNIKKGSTIDTAPTSTKTNYTLDGWYTELTSGTKVVFPYTVTKDVTLYARWKPVNYKITFDSNGGSAVTAKTGAYNTSVTLPTPTRTYYTFTGWYTAKTGGTKVASPRKYTKNETLYAHWTVKALSTPVLTVKAYDYKTIKLSWTKVSGATKYTVYRATSKTGTYKPVRLSTGSTYTDTITYTGQTYYYKVKASNPVTYKYSTVKYTATTLKTPTSFAAKKYSSTSARLSWVKPAGATGVEIYYRSSSTSKYTKVTSATKTSYIKKSLSKGKTYYFKIRAYRNVNGRKAYSAYTSSKYVKM